MATMPTLEERVDTSYEKDRAALENELKTAIDYYNKAMAEGRAQDAYAMGDAIRRLQATASATGMSRFARQEAINRIQARINEEGRKATQELLERGMTTRAGMLGNITALDENQRNAWLRMQQENRQAQQNQQQLDLNKKQFEWDKLQEERAAEAKRLAAVAQREAERKMQQQQTWGLLQNRVQSNVAKNAAAAASNPSINLFRPYPGTSRSLTYSGGLGGTGRAGWTSGIQSRTGG